MATVNAGERGAIAPPHEEEFGERAGGLENSAIAPAVVSGNLPLFMPSKPPAR
jgi:hypothetical protein